MLKKAKIVLISAKNRLFSTARELWVKSPDDLKYIIVLSILLWGGWNLIALWSGWPNPPIYSWFGLLLIIDSVIGYLTKIIKEIKIELRGEG